MVEEICCYNFISTELFKPLPKRKRDDIILFTCRKLCGRVSAVEQHSGVIVDSLHNRKQLVNLLLGKLNSLILKNTVNILRFTTKRDMFMQSRNQPICIDFSVVLLKPFPQLRIMRLAIGITVFQNLFCFVFADNVTGFALMHTLHRLVIPFLRQNSADDIAVPEQKILCIPRERFQNPMQTRRTSIASRTRPVPLTEN